MATKIGRFKIRDNQVRGCADSSEAEFMNELNGTDEELKERPEQTAAREFKRRSRERWGNGGNQASPSRPLLAAQGRDGKAQTPAQRFKQASRIRHGAR